MTLGSTPTPAEIVEELGESFPYTFPDAKTRWLAEVGASDPITIPTDFSSKSSVKVIATASASASGTSHTFSGVNFGLAFSGRRLIACVGLYASGSVTLNQTSCTIGGTSTVGDDAGENLGSGPSCGAGIWAGAVASGTSGNVVINWTGGAATHAGLILLSASGGFSTTAHDEVNGATGGGSGGSNTGTKSLNIPSNGILIASVMHANLNNTNLSGVTERSEITVGSGRLCVGFDNRKNSQTGDTLSASWSGSTAYGMEARSYSQ
jgi:hypothetical protein